MNGARGRTGGRTGGWWPPPPWLVAVLGGVGLVVAVIGVGVVREARDRAVAAEGFGSYRDLLALGWALVATGALIALAGVLAWVRARRDRDR